MFTIDYSKAQEFATITDGTYEVVVKSAKPDASKGGTDFMNIQFKIRDDFDQKFKNNLIFHKIWTTKATGAYQDKDLANIAIATELPRDLDFKDEFDFCNHITGKHLKVTVRNETSEYNGNTYENLNVKKLEKSDIMAPAQVSAPTIDDTDLPF